jgi:hypothetical protein
MIMDKDILKSVMYEVFEELNNIGNNDHSEHHAWIHAQIESEKNRKEMYKAITRSALQWSIPFLFTGVIYWLQTGHWPKV